MPAERLEAIQRFMLAAISHEDGLEAGLERDEARALIGDGALEDLILPGPRLEARDRLAIYADMYYWRLVDVLADDHPRLREFLGREAFARLARAYVHRHPSRHPNLAQLGREFPAFLRDEALDLPERELAVDIASLECALSRVFDAEREDSLGAEALVGIEPSDWPDLGLDLVAAAEILALEHDLEPWLDDGMPASRRPERRASFLLVHRRDDELFRIALDEAQAVCLEALRAGRSILDAIEVAFEAAQAAEDDFVAGVGLWFRSWSALGLFRRLVRKEA